MLAGRGKTDALEEIRDKCTLSKNEMLFIQSYGVLGSKSTPASGGVPDVFRNAQLRTTTSLAEVMDSAFRYAFSIVTRSSSTSVDGVVKPPPM